MLFIDYVMWLFTYYLMNSSEGKHLAQCLVYIVDTTITSILQTGKLRHRLTNLPKVTELVRGRTGI